MLLELEEHGWERDDFADVIFDGNELLFSYSHPSYPRCSLVLNIKISFLPNDFGPDRVRSTLSIALALDGEEVLHCYEDSMSPAHITRMAELYQRENDDGFSGTCGYDQS
jgi:hypothetical protein